MSEPAIRRTRGPASYYPQAIYPTLIIILVAVDKSHCSTNFTYSRPDAITTLKIDSSRVEPPKRVQVDPLRSLFTDTIPCPSSPVDTEAKQDIVPSEDADSLRLRRRLDMDGKALRPLPPLPPM